MGVLDDYELLPNRLSVKVFLLIIKSFWMKFLIYL